jgi:uncharacterized protein
MSSLPNYTDCLKLLFKYSVPSNVISHLIFTTQTAIAISKQLKKRKFKIKCDLVLAGAMLHDIGRCRTHDIDHGIVGGQILRQQGYSEDLARIVENHLFAGIEKAEAMDLGLPPRDFLPETLEEKIIAYADNISKGGKFLTTEEVVDRYTKYLDRSHPVILRVRHLHNYIENLLNQK